MDKTGSKQTCGSTRTIRRCRTFYAAEDKVLVSFPESISAFGETQADAIRLIEGWLNADTAQRVRQYGKELWIMTWTPEVGLTTPENLKKIHPFRPDALLINDVTTLRP